MNYFLRATPDRAEAMATRLANYHEELRKEREAMGCPPPADELEEGPIAAAIPGPPVHQPELPGNDEDPNRR